VIGSLAIEYYRRIYTALIGHAGYLAFCNERAAVGGRPVIGTATQTIDTVPGVVYRFNFTFSTDGALFGAVERWTTTTKRG
jgi:hypothetical protein